MEYFDAKLTTVANGFVLSVRTDQKAVDYVFQAENGNADQIKPVLAFLEQLYNNVAPKASLDVKSEDKKIKKKKSELLS